MRAELIDRYGELPPQAESLFQIAELRLFVGRKGARTLSVQGGKIRIEPLPLLDSQQVRLRRLFPGAIFKPTTFTAVVPEPVDPPGGLARWLYAALQELFADD